MLPFGSFFHQFWHILKVVNSLLHFYYFLFWIITGPWISFLRLRIYLFQLFALQFEVQLVIQSPPSLIFNRLWWHFKIKLCKWMLSFCCLQALSGFPPSCVVCSHPKRSILLLKNFCFLQTYQHAKADVENLQRRKNLLIINTVNSNASWGCSLKTQYSVKKREGPGIFLPCKAASQAVILWGQRWRWTGCHSWREECLEA